MKKLIVLMVLVSFPTFAQFRTLDWNKDKWNSPKGHFLRYDKIEHCIGSAGLTISLTTLDEKNGWKYTLLAGFLWEVKDGFMPFEKYGHWGGEGFSTKDLIADVIGVAIGYGIFKGGKWLLRIIKGGDYSG